MSVHRRKSFHETICTVHCLTNFLSGFGVNHNGLHKGIFVSEKLKSNIKGNVCVCGGGVGKINSVLLCF